MAWTCRRRSQARGCARGPICSTSRPDTDHYHFLSINMDWEVRLRCDGSEIDAMAWACRRRSQLYLRPIRVELTSTHVSPSLLAAAMV